MTRDKMTLTELDYKALRIISANARISSQQLAMEMGLRRACGLELTPQGAGRLGATKGARLRKMGLVRSELVHGGYCNGFFITEQGRLALKGRAQ